MMSIIMSPLLQHYPEIMSGTFAAAQFFKQIANLFYIGLLFIPPHPDIIYGIMH